LPSGLCTLDDVSRFVSQFTNQSGIILVNVVAERLLPFQHDHPETIRIRFFESLADARHRLHRRRVLGHQ
jgi:hypothetical protein